VGTQHAWGTREVGTARMGDTRSSRCYVGLCILVGKSEDMDHLKELDVYGMIKLSRVGGSVTYRRGFDRIC
jgi:hypothetical protein